MYRRSSAGTTAVCATKLRVLSDPTRLAVLRILLSGAKKVGDINAELSVEQSLLSHHLKVLRDAGLVTTARDGKTVRYRLATPVNDPCRQKGLNLGCCFLSFDEIAQ
jgi:DNA-binding transcriptional ArsR family regulator